MTRKHDRSTARRWWSRQSHSGARTAVSWWWPVSAFTLGVKLACAALRGRDWPYPDARVGQQLAPTTSGGLLHVKHLAPAAAPNPYQQTSALANHLALSQSDIARILANSTPYRETTVQPPNTTAGVVPVRQEKKMADQDDSGKVSTGEEQLRAALRDVGVFTHGEAGVGRVYSPVLRCWIGPEDVITWSPLTSATDIDAAPDEVERLQRKYRANCDHLMAERGALVSRPRPFVSASVWLFPTSGLAKFLKPQAAIITKVVDRLGDESGRVDLVVFGAVPGQRDHVGVQYLTDVEHGSARMTLADSRAVSFWTWPNEVF